MKRSNINIGSLDLELAVVDTSVPVQKKYCNQLNRHLRDYVTYGESLMQQVYKFKEEHWTLIMTRICMRLSADNPLDDVLGSKIDFRFHFTIFLKIN